ncbi:unnamed protein product [Orchesella dallaii]|uniref:Uncharacterized protein n=1 Tax=Orchesella dallaii TaxID=48710 RepID=A0ABP1RC25_9HEXA
MSPPFSKGKGFKNDKRNLIESSNNLVVLGQGASRRLQDANRRFRGKRSRSRSQSKTRPLVPGPTLPVIGAFGQRTRVLTVDGNSPNRPPWISSTVLRQQQPFSLTASVTTPTPGELKYLLPFQSSDKEKKHGAVTCGVCGRGFEPPKFNSDPVSDIMRNSLKSYQKSGLMTKRNLEDGWGSITGKPKINVEPQDVVCVGTCGELFHKLCLRDYCSHHHNKNAKGPNCPRCGLEVKFLNCQEIDILSCFSNNLTVFEKHVYKTMLMNKELQVLWPEANNHLTKLKQEISDAETIYHECRSQRRRVKSELKKLTADDLGIVMAKITDVTTLKATLDKQEKALEFMQQETLQIMRMYLITVLRKLKAFAPSGDFSSLPNIPQKIPRELIPVLGNMLNDDEALAMLSRIVAPRQDEIMDEAKQKIMEQKILEKYGKQAGFELERKNTYTVFSSSDAPELDDTEPEDVDAGDADGIGVQINSSEFASGEDTSAYINKSSNATDSVPDITPLVKAPVFQCESIETREKPPKILNIMELIQSEIIMKEWALSSKKSTPAPPSTQSSGNGNEMPGGMPKPMTKQSSMEAVAGSDIGFGEDSQSGAGQVSYQPRETDFPSPRHSEPVQNTPEVAAPVAEAEEVHEASQNSLRITEILKAKETSDEKESIPNSNNSSAMSQQRQNIQLPSINPSSNETKSLVIEKPPQVHEVIVLSTPEAHSGRSWSTVSDDEEVKIDVVNLGVEAIIPVVEKPPEISEFKEPEIGESCIKMDCGSFCVVKSIAPSPPLEVVEKFDWNNTAESEAAYNVECEGKKPIFTLDSNGRLDFSKEPKTSKSATSLPKLSNAGQVSIAIMYIIETSEEEEDEDEGTDEESDTGEDQDDCAKELASDNHNNPSVLAPVYLTADKTSNYSIIANENSDLACSNPNENGIKKEPNYEGGVGLGLGAYPGFEGCSTPTPRAKPERIGNGNRINNNGGFGLTYRKHLGKVDVTVSYENEKVIKRTQNVGRKLLSK